MVKITEEAAAALSQAKGLVIAALSELETRSGVHKEHLNALVMTNTISFIS